MFKTFRNLAIVLVGLAICITPALAQRTNIRPAWNLFTTQQDVEMGRILMNDVERSFQLVDNRDANAYIDALGKHLTSHVPQGQYPYQFKIIADDSVNAWALPGGFIYVTSGLVRTAQNEPELAGALAHEIAHVILRHGTAEVSQAYSDRVSNASRDRVSVNDAMSTLNIHFDRNSVPLRYTREEERQADVRAAQILYDANFDPQQMAQFFQRINGANYSDFFNDHPYLNNLSAIVRTEVRNLGPVRSNVRGDSPDFHSVKDRLLTASNAPYPSDRDRYRDRNNGYSPDQPSTRFTLYRGRDIEFRYPDNWRVSDEGETISVVPDGGFVSGSMAYGMTVGVFDARNSGYYGRNSFSSPGARNDNSSLANATDQLVQFMQQSNPNMRVVRNSQRTRVDGMQALVLDLVNDSPVGGMETDRLVTVFQPNGLLRYFIGVAPDNEFGRYQNTFDQIVASVRLLQ